jgi:hypothetical protein
MQGEKPSRGSSIAAHIKNPASLLKQGQQSIRMYFSDRRAVIYFPPSCRII